MTNPFVGLWRKIQTEFSRPPACTTCGCPDNLSHILYYDTCSTCRAYVDGRYRQANMTNRKNNFETSWEKISEEYQKAFMALYWLRENLLGHAMIKIKAVQELDDLLNFQHLIKCVKTVKHETSEEADGPWKNKTHFGDCTKESCGCETCFLKKLEKGGKRIFEKTFT